ncbi:multidrug transporter [Clostridium carboxidivorans P7]|uniref:Major facilitator superfamily MFS_1 n=1 Tax=Clostridium carboxidivorans P7 TaxID=536227 RepID=C6PTG8_9CLOT|nr:tetracycline resistance MFS efflux pump [Clostridium carboxidivorans]AKN33725.1 multidrug transporter [Clostridium carboxidivorans P7]EET87491.1 major facilitator superfamily MFS_1 [Clostridium carboxidivorans P7]EFG86676.1 transporter, major facilitator family protein [Clostridium carboxidivorans P7]
MENSYFKKLPLFILMINLFIALLGQGMVIPILPEYLKQFNAAGSAAGYLVAAFGAAQFLFSPIGGRLSDRYGRKIMIFSGMILTVISDFIFAVSPYLMLLYIARFIGGIGLGIMIPSVLAYVSDVTSKDTRAKGMGYLSAAMNLGMVLGPGIGGMIANFGIRVPYFFAAALGIASTLLTLILPETLPIEKRTASKGSEQQESIVEQLVKSAHTSYFRYLILIFIMTFGLVNYETVYSLFVEHKYGFTTQQVSVLITLGAAIGIIVQVWLIDKVIKRYGEYKTIRFSLVMAAIALVLMLLKVNFIYLILVSSVFFTFNSLLRPTVNTMLSKEAGDQQGFVSGLNNMYTSLGNIIGPILAGNLFDKQINLPYILGAFILLITTCLVRKESKMQNNEVIINE